MSILRLLFSFYGRIGRAKFWLGTLIVLISWILIIRFMPGLMPDRPSPIAAAFVAMPIITVEIITLALSVKRCHDRGRSGWWSAISIIPIVGPIWWITNLGILPGIKGPNKYGPDPRGFSAEVFA